MAALAASRRASDFLSQLVVRPDTCYAQGDVDSSTGESIAFVRGPGTSEAVQIEHVVALSGLWHKGARDWDEEGRLDSPTIRTTCLPLAQKPTPTRLSGTPTPGAAQRRIPLRIRRTAGCGENHLAALGFGERETRDGSGVGPLLAEGDQAAAGCKRMSHPHVVRFGG